MRRIEHLNRGICIYYSTDVLPLRGMLCVEIGAVGRPGHGRHADDLRDDQA